jgi:GNAT superfamily N-acetyltransferase
VIRIRNMTLADIELGMRLKGQAGWNQVEADWRRFIALQPDGCFVAEWNGAPVGTAVACMFEETGWLAMVLVDQTARGHGIGTLLVEQAVKFLDRMGAQTIRLDATSLGQPLYAKFGFAAEYEIVRYSGLLSAPAKTSVSAMPAHVRTARAGDYEEILQLDRRVVFTDRRRFLLQLFKESPNAVRPATVYGAIAGYLTVRHGSEALQIGPCVAAGEVGGALLVDAARCYTGQRAMIDVPRDNSPAQQCAVELNLTEQRTFVRMYRGVRICDDLSQVWASSGPELG